MKLEDISYYSSGLYSSDTDTGLPTLRGDKCTVILVLSGQIEIQHNRNAVTVGANEIFISHADISVFSENQRHVGFFWVLFDELPDDLSLPEHMLCGSTENLKALFKQLHYFSGAPNHQKAALDSLLRLVLMEINLQHTSVGDARELSCSSPLSIRIYDYIRRNADKKITAEDVALQFGYNRDYLTRLIKKEGFPSIKQLIISTKLDYIKALLSTTALSIKEISVLTDFESTNDFLKFFKTHEGITPTEFRKMCDKVYAQAQSKII